MKALFLIAIGLAVAHPALAAPPSLPGGATGGFLPGSFPMAFGAERLGAEEAGSWVEYVATLEGKPVGSYLRYVYAGRDEQGLWMELWLSSKPGSAATAFRILFEVDAEGRLRTRRVWQKLLGGVPAEVELPEGEPDPTAGRAPFTERTTTVMTRAGSFSARELSMGEGKNVVRFFVTDALPLFGLARMDLGKGQGLEVHAFGKKGRLVFGPPGSSAPPPRGGEGVKAPAP